MYLGEVVQGQHQEEEVETEKTKRAMGFVKSAIPPCSSNHR